MSVKIQTTTFVLMTLAFSPMESDEAGGNLYVPRKDSGDSAGSKLFQFDEVN